MLYALFLYALCFYALQVAHELAEQPAQPLEPATALVAPLSLLLRAAKTEISRRISLP
jgi:hypothetical protein